MSAQENYKGQGVSHAADSSVPASVQKKVPHSVEDELPDSVHNTGSNDKTGKVSHATGPKGSIVPQVCMPFIVWLRSLTISGTSGRSSSKGRENRAKRYP